MILLRLSFRLLAFAAGAAIVASGCAGTDGSVAAMPPRNALPNPIEQSFVDEVNRYRQSLHLKPLVLNDVLTQQARMHSTNMAKGRIAFGHTGFPGRAKAIRSYLSVLEISENLAVNQGYADPVSVAFQTLMASPGHRKNIEGDFDMTGIGVAKSSDGRFFFTQMFADGAGRFR